VEMARRSGRHETCWSRPRAPPKDGVRANARRSGQGSAAPHAVPARRCGRWRRWRHRSAAFRATCRDGRSDRLRRARARGESCSSPCRRRRASSAKAGRWRESWPREVSRTGEAVTCSCYAPCGESSMPIDYLQKILTVKVYDVAIETPLDLAPTLSRRLGNRVWLKREDQQSVFSFKLRGAYNKMAHLSAAERAKGVIAAAA